jgi:hypothetical protein
MPQAVWLEPLPDGSTNVWLARNVVKTTPEDETESEGYVADLAFFNTSDQVTEEQISTDFDGWWLYAEEWEADPGKVTLEQRLDNVEAALLAILGI